MLLSQLCTLMQRTWGYAADETLAVFDRTSALAEKTGNLAQVVLGRIGTWAAVYAGGDYANAEVIAAQIRDLAEREGSDQSLAFAHSIMVIMGFDRGELVSAEEHVAQMRTFVDRMDPDQISEALRLAVVNSFGFASLVAWMLGRADVARTHIAHAKVLADESKNPFNLSCALQLEGYLRRWLREPQTALEAASKSIAICEKQGFDFNRYSTGFIMGWAKAQLGQPADGIALIRGCLTGGSAFGIRADITNQLTILAEAQALDGALDEALTTLTEALAANPLELIFQPNILTWRGRLELEVGRRDAAEADFRDAIARARKMSAKLPELRATVDLAQLLRDTNRRDEARAMLSEMYNWFTEGFDTPDLKDAKALLEELGA